MSVFKCKMCGGQLEIADKTGICTCEYCGAQQTIPKVADEGTQGLFNRANILRMKAEFDKASDIYEKILQSDSTESEAYWGLILCKYGIEYVLDPATSKRIPTCHRASYESVISDEDYRLALKYADTDQRNIYESEAKRIDDIQKNIIDLAQKNSPYDVFICYKETDDNNQRTQDSAIANDIYYQLTQAGYKVFYSAISLEDKLGQEYEPYIFSALNTAKVMLVIGTKIEYFNSPWVKNEWSRFLKIMKSDRSRLLIPCYKYLDAYELPEEFAHLQSQNMEKIGFVNDILHGIKKVIYAQKEENDTSSTYDKRNHNNSNINSILKRGYISLEDGEWERAEDFFEEALYQNAECAEAYMGKLLVKQHAHSLNELGKYYEYKHAKVEQEILEACAEAHDHIQEKINEYAVLPDYLPVEKIVEAYNFDRTYKSYLKSYKKQKENILTEIRNEKLLQRAKQYANDSFKNEIELFVSKITSKYEIRIIDAEEEEKKKIDVVKTKYREHIDKVDRMLATESKEALEAKKQFYLDAIQMFNEAKTPQEYDEVRNMLEPLGNYKESKIFVTSCEQRITEITEDIARRTRRQILKKRILKVSILSILLGVGIGLNVYYKIIYPKRQYDRAQELVAQGRLNDAVIVLTDIKDYKDSQSQIYKLNVLITEENLAKEKEAREIAYNNAKTYIENKEYDNAISSIYEVGDYDKVIECKYLLAKAYCEDNKLDEAFNMLSEFNYYNDEYKNKANELGTEIDYRRAKLYMKEKDYLSARILFERLGDYKDSKERAAKAEKKYNEQGN